MSKLRGVKPSKVKKRLKLFIYGGAGVGKTTAAIQFPSPYLIDTEKGSTNDQYIDLLEKSNGVIFQSSDFNEVFEELKSLLKENHSFKTIIIDPLTTIYNDLLEKCAKKRITANDLDGTAFGGHYKMAAKKMEELINLLLRLDMNVIISAHSKTEYGNNLAVLGQTFDCYKKLDFLFDTVFEVQKRGKERVAVIKKSRIESFPDGECFTFSYEEIAKRYDKNMLEKDCVLEKLASKEQIENLEFLIDLYHEPEDVVQKWLDKAGATTFEEVNCEIMEKLIVHMQNKSQLVNSKEEKNKIVNLQGAA